MDRSDNIPDISIVFRALNEGKWFRDALTAVQSQTLEDLTYEIVLVDSGSIDDTLDIAAEFGCRITHIAKSDFSFGRSLNQGCEFAKGKYLVFISAHCIPSHDRWLENLIEPLVSGSVSYVYGRQIGHEVSQFSEKQLFNKYFPAESHVPQEGFFINNANSAILSDVWEEYKFDESVTGLEDMVLGKAISKNGLKIGYIATAPVFHIHEESFKQTQNRYYREALTLRDILPDIDMGFFDFVRYWIVGVYHDLIAAFREKQLSQTAKIIKFRYAQFRGSYKGHNEVKKLSRKQKESYYYPTPDKVDDTQTNSPPKITSKITAE